MAKGRWEQALHALEELLAEHEGADYVIRQRDSIIEDHKRCAFYRRHPRPEPEDLISGELVSWSESSGKIGLRYTGEDLEDWSEEGNGFFVHPAPFAGSYTFSMQGEKYPTGQETLVLAADVGARGFYSIVFGYPPVDHGLHEVWLPMSISYMEGEEREELDSKRISPVDPGKPFLAAVKVTSSSIVVYYNKRIVLRARKKERGSYGRVGFLRQPFGEIALEGKIEPSWFQGIADEKLAALREDFDRRYKPRRELPEWLFAEIAADRTPPKAPNKLYPGSLRSRHFDFLNEGMDLLNGGKPREAIEHVAAGDDGDAPEAARSYLLALARFQLGDLTQALEHCESAAEADPELWTVRSLRARILRELRRPDEAIAELHAAVADDPGEVRLYQPLVTTLLERGRVEEAERLVKGAMAEHGLHKELADLDRMLRMARVGPDWVKRYSYSSRHYTVHSDIDERVCVDATRLLEQAYVTYQAQLTWVKDDSDKKFEVFLFSGENGYQDYCRQILGSQAPHTAGLYSPVLEQLLIWNLPKREDMMRTIRHEGFHQFLDRVMDSPPVWLNEGMAEYYETSQYTRGRFDGGQRRPLHLAVLLEARKDLPSLRELVSESRQQFYANARLRYPHAWAFVHFLRQSTADNRRLFERLFDSLREDGSTQEAVERAFQGVDFDELETGFWAHVESMR